MPLDTHESAKEILYKGFQHFMLNLITTRSLHNLQCFDG